MKLNKQKCSNARTRFTSTACFTYAVSAAGLLTFQNSFADFYYYNNVIVGDRAMGLGGAYSAIADDSSALVYNPAGLGFALSNAISGAANAFYYKNVEFKKTIGEKSFFEKNSGFFPAFTGGTRKLDNIWNNLVFGFAIYSPDNEFKDQDDTINEPNLGIESFHYSQSRQASNLKVAIGVGRRFAPWLSFGLGTAFTNLQDNKQTYQDSVLKYQAFPLTLKATNSAPKSIYLTQQQALKSKLSALGIEPIIGVQVMPTEKLSLAVSYKKNFIFSQNFEAKFDSSQYLHYADYTLLKTTEIEVPETPSSAQKAVLGIVEKNVVRTVQNENFSNSGSNGKSKISEPFSEGESELRAGAALFANQNLLIAADFSYHFLANGNLDFSFRREPTLNYHIGVEYFATPSVPVRIGFYTNNDSRPELSNTPGADYGEKIDYLGSSLFSGWNYDSGQIGAGVSAQLGKGKSRKIQGLSEAQNVKAYSIAIALTAAHNL